ncbi:isochorismatase family protein [Weissella viridescens]|uniref:Isochorismatase family protein n=1 Tax=Weissella viridescens TaxID=1629 RepID=A0A3P2RLG1_WEIVI|nr:isochorismatase family protein [Weissella viridescens]RRG18308.1 isochorismatase family protein [Weissella viridescens]
MNPADVLIIIDMQNGICRQNELESLDLTHLIQQINDRVQVYRTLKQPIIWIQHHDDSIQRETVAWNFLPELEVNRTIDIIIEKDHPDSFHNTRLTAQLNQLEAQRLEICGAQVEFCVDTTIKAAFDRGYQLFMYPNMTTTWDNAWMSAKQTQKFYENIWQNTFVSGLA